MRRLGFIVLLATMYSMPARAATLTFENLRSTGANTFSVDVHVDLDDLSVGEDLFTFGFDVLYDPMAAELTGATLGPVLPGPVVDPLAPPPDLERGSFIQWGADPSQDPLLNGFVFGSVFDLSAGGPTGATEGGRLATLDFELSASNADVQFLNVLLLTSQGNLIPTTIVNDAIELEAGTPVPEPSTIALLAIGLVPLSRRRLRRN